MSHCSFKKRTPGKKQLLKLSSPRYSADSRPVWSGVKVKTEGISVASDPDSTGLGNPEKTSYGLGEQLVKPTPLFQTVVSSVSFVAPIVTCFPGQLLALCFTLLLDCQQHAGREQGLCHFLLVMFSLKCPAPYSEFNRYPTHTKGTAFSSPWNDLCIYQCAPMNQKTTSLIFKGYFEVSIFQKYRPTIVHSSQPVFQTSMDFRHIIALPLSCSLSFQTGKPHICS